MEEKKLPCRLFLFCGDFIFGVRKSVFIPTSSKCVGGRQMEEECLSAAGSRSSVGAIEEELEVKGFPPPAGS